MKKKTQIIFTCGGTGGHVYPLIALAQELNNVNITFICSKDREDKDIIPKYGYDFKSIDSSNKNPIKIAKGFFKSLYILRKSDIKMLISSGGYLTLPVVIAAWILRKKVFILEQNALPGRVNLFSAKFAEKIFLSFDESKKYFNDKAIVKGNPVRKEFIATKSDNAFFNIIPQNNKLTLLVIGGSQGAYNINDFFLKNYKRINSKGFNLIVLTGRKYFDEKLANNSEFSQNKPVKEHILIKGSADIAFTCFTSYIEAVNKLFGYIDVCVSRSGATIISELLYFKKKAILIPFPYAKDNHQLKNAESAIKRSAAVLLEENNLNFNNLMDGIDSLLEKEYENFDFPNARKNISKIIIDYLADMT